MKRLTLTDALASLDPNAVYSEDEAQRVLRLRGKRCLVDARRKGRLRSAMIGQARVFRGSWLLDWLELEARGPLVRPASVNRETSS